MPDSIQRIRDELASLGYEPVVFESPQGTAVSFRYTIETGSYAKQTVNIAVSAPDGEYPEYAPHWVHISPPIDDRRGGALNKYNDSQGQEWLAMSRPPADIWDRLSTKNMRSYINEHLRRIWKDV